MTNKPRYLLKWLQFLKRRTGRALLLIVVLASAAMIVTNYYTIKILNSTRAYINGESQYSKGQKDASAHLINYIYLGDTADYTAFEKYISIPEGDHIARNALRNGDLQTAREGFLQAMNHPDDIDDMIWFFGAFKNVSLFHRAIEIWVAGDAMVDQLRETGVQAQQKIMAGEISVGEKKELILSINNISGDLTIKEQDFSNTLGVLCRIIKRYIFIADVLIILVIVISSLSYAGIMIRDVHRSQRIVVEQNENLQVINAGLDKFVFNVTHDLRSPLVSLVGLIGLIDEETDLRQIKAYTLMMKESLEKQERFVHEMLTFIKSKHTGLVKKECSLSRIIADVFSQNPSHSKRKAIKFIVDAALDSIESDALKIQVILNNLVTNSIKYCDPAKEEQWVRVKTYRNKSEAVIEVDDNGLGIRKNDQERIFDKFYMSGDNKRSSGIGLYLVKDAVTQMNGRIEVKSEPGLYTTFTISIPL